MARRRGYRSSPGKGYDVTVVCLSYGERGESAKLWKQPGCTLEHVKTERRKEAEAAAKALTPTIFNSSIAATIRWNWTGKPSSASPM